jgi:HTH-type transcriptional regulator, sugar sensing transcriptional regulator
MIYEKLQKIGLTEKEAKIYVSLLELGETSVQRIAKKAKIKRTTIYNAIDSLKEKGLVSTILKKKRKYYLAADPRELESKIEQQKNILKRLMPELLSITNLIDKKPKIKFYEGVEGLREIYLDFLNYPNSSLWSWETDDDSFTKNFDDGFIEYYAPKRIGKKIMVYIIAPDSLEMKIYKKNDTGSLRQIRLDPNGKNLQVEIDVYGFNKIAIVSFKENFGLIIESKTIYDTIKNIFDEAWKKLE